MHERIYCRKFSLTDRNFFPNSKILHLFGIKSEMINSECEIVFGDFQVLLSEYFKTRSVYFASKTIYFVAKCSCSRSSPWTPGSVQSNQDLGLGLIRGHYQFRGFRIYWGGFFEKLRTYISYICYEYIGTSLLVYVSVMSHHL